MPDSSNDDLLIRAREASPALVVELTGNLDEWTVEDFRRAVSRLDAGTKRTLVLDMSAVRYVDSHGFGALIAMRKRLLDQGRSMVLAACQEPVKTALALTRLEVLFPNYPTVDSIPPSA